MKIGKFTRQAIFPWTNAKSLLPWKNTQKPNTTQK
jgi:hypothetical protein